MNRKGKKSPLTRANTDKVSPKSEEKSSQTKKSAKHTKQKKTKAKGVVAKNPRLKHNLANSKGSPNSHKLSLKPRKQRLSLWLVIYAVTIAVGIGTILGTTISLVSSLQSSPTSNPALTKEVLADSNNSKNKAKLERLFAIASLGKEIAPLKVKLEELAQQYSALEPNIFLVDLDTKGFVSIQGQKSIAAASTIKFPVLVAFLQDVDRGKINLDEQLTMTKELIGEGSGNMRYEKPGSKFSALETVEKMMTISDNTATNMLVARLGGKEVLNQRFKKMKLTETSLQSPLPDLEGTNTTSSEDLGNLLVEIDNGELISLRSRDRLLHIMSNIENDTLLPQGLDPGAIIAHKTGDIKSVLADVGLIDMPNGKRYIASVLVKRPENSPQASELIQKVSRLAYQYFQNPQSSSFNSKED